MDSFLVVLRQSLGVAVGSNNVFYRLNTQLGTEVHQSVVDIFYVGRVGNVESLLADDAASIDVVVEEESGDASLRLTVDDGPVDGCSAAIVG